MNWRRRLAALFVVLALAGCSQSTMGQSGGFYPTPRGIPASDQSTAEEIWVAGATACNDGAGAGLRCAGQRAMSDGHPTTSTLGLPLVSG
jgi:hypothetical protein